MKKTEHERLLALFAIALVSHLPPDLGRRIADQLDELGEIAHRDGDTTVGKGAKDLASLLARTAAMPRKGAH